MLKTICAALMVLVCACGAVDGRPPHAVALSELRRQVLSSSLFSVQLRSDLAAALLAEIDRVAIVAKAAVSAWESEDVQRSMQAIEDLRTAWGRPVVRTREPARKGPPEHEVLAAPPSWVRPKEHHKSSVDLRDDASISLPACVLEAAAAEHRRKVRGQ